MRDRVPQTARTALHIMHVPSHLHTTFLHHISSFTCSIPFQPPLHILPSPLHTTLSLHISPFTCFYTFLTPSPHLTLTSPHYSPSSHLFLYLFLYLSNPLSTTYPDLSTPLFFLFTSLPFLLNSILIHPPLHFLPSPLRTSLLFLHIFSFIPFYTFPTPSPHHTQTSPQLPSPSLQLFLFPFLCSSNPLSHLTLASPHISLKFSKTSKTSIVLCNKLSNVSQCYYGHCKNALKYKKNFSKFNATAKDLSSRV